MNAGFHNHKNKLVCESVFFFPPWELLNWKKLSELLASLCSFVFTEAVILDQRLISYNKYLWVLIITNNLQHTRLSFSWTHTQICFLFHIKVFWPGILSTDAFWQTSTHCIQTSFKSFVRALALCCCTEFEPVNTCDNFSSISYYAY